MVPPALIIPLLMHALMIAGVQAFRNPTIRKSHLKWQKY